jgi:O-antigen biosynthesis protein
VSGAALPSATIAVVNFNTPDDVPGCLDALLALDYPSVEIVVVDNSGAEGGRPVALGDRYPRARVLTPGTNLGFAGGANLAWQSSAAGLLGVVNPDVRVRPDWLTALARGLREHVGQRAAIAGGKLLYPDGRVQHAGGAFQFPAGTAAHIGRGEPDSPAFGQDREMAYVTGAALVITRAAAVRLGYFDAGFWPVYFEDVDLCARAWEAGYSVWYIPAAVATHTESASLAHGGASYFRYYQRNRLRYVLRHYDRARTLTEFAPAEEARLRGDLEAEDRRSALNLYADARALHGAPAGGASAPLPSADASPPVARRARLLAAVGETQQRWRVAAQPFRSRIPGVAWLRTRFNNLWTRWYVEPILAQQVEYNAALARAVRELADQVSGLEAALLVRAGLHEVTPAAPPGAAGAGEEGQGSEQGAIGT